jgi:methyltransferase
MVLSHVFYVALVALVATQRLCELHRSRRHLSLLRARGRIVHEEPAYIAMVGVHVALLVCAPLEVITLHRPLNPTVAAISLVALVFAQLVRAWVFRTLGSSWTTRVVQPVGIVTSGPFRYVRHPNYAIVILEFIALPMVHGAWLTALVGTFANAAVLARRIPLEERVLARDVNWREAFNGVPRLFPFPRMRRSLARGTRTAVT